MDLHNVSAYTRRLFLRRGATLASSALTVPFFLESSARALAQPTGVGTSAPGVPEDRVLVVLQLSGGNDGLNTVVPLGRAAYYDARPGIAIPEAEAIRLARGDDVGLHPRLAPLRALHDEGMLAVVQGVGYPNPNRSHFMSMDIWHTADLDGVGTGWLGRYFDNECRGHDAKARASGAEPLPADRRSGVAIGREAPRALEGRATKPIAFDTADLFRWTGEDLHDALAAPYAEIAKAGVVDGEPPDSAAGFLMRTAMDAQISSERIRRAVASPAAADFPRSDLGRQLAMVAAMIRAGMRTRVYYVSLGGFDTHAGQGGAQGRHAQLLGEFAEALRAFYADLKATGNDGRVLTLTFSEFGRRVRQNASNGTDHGAAAPVFLTGPMVRPGVLNDHPSLTDLDDGDVRHTVDFRSVYAGILKDWLRADPAAVVGRTPQPARLFRKA